MTTKVQSELIANNAILTQHIDDNQVTADQIADATVTTTQIAANTIATGNIADNAIDSTKIASNSILTRHIDDNQIGIDQLNVSDGSSGQALTTNGSGTLSFADVGVAGITSSADATAITITSSENVGIGITDPDQALEIGAGGQLKLSRADNSRSMVLFTDNNNATIQSDQDPILIQSAHRMMFNTNGGNERMRIDTNGKLIIGDTASHTDDLFQIETPASGGGHGIQIRRNDSNGDQGIGRIMFGNNNDTDLATIQATTDGQADSARLTFNTQATSGSSTEQMRITSDGKVGIGKTDPNYKLVVAGTNPKIQIYDSAGSGQTNLYFGDSGHNLVGYVIYQHSNNHMRLGTDNEDRLKLTSDDGSGSYGRAEYTSSWGRFDFGALNNGYHHIQAQTGPSKFYFNVRCEASGGFHTYSDENLKQDITPIAGALDSVAKMKGITFKWKDAKNRGGHDAGKQFGVTAQNMLEVDAQLPSLDMDPLYNSQDKDGNWVIDGVKEDDKYYTMDYSRLTPFFIEAIKELKSKLEAAETRITELGG